jgi:hypothetical protein
MAQLSSLSSPPGRELVYLKSADRKKKKISQQPIAKKKKNQPTAIF